MDNFKKNYMNNSNITINKCNHQSMINISFFEEKHIVDELDFKLEN